MQQAVLILGMHRSGTSAIAGVSHLLGAATPATMMEAAFDNPAGFWESETIAGLNEAILQSAGCGWFDCLAFRPASLTASYRHELPAHGCSALAREFGDAPLYVLKDPRFSLLSELWLPIFAALNVTVAPLLALRHPAEVIASLRRRDDMPAEIAAPMWLHYMLEAEHHTRNRPRVVLSYDKLLHDWRAAMGQVTAATGLVWPVPLESAAASVGEFLRPQLRHHYAAPRMIAAGKPPVRDWITEAYDALCRIETCDDPAQFARLDRVREQFAIWRASAPRVSVADATALRLPRTIGSTPPATGTGTAASPGRGDSFR